MHRGALGLPRHQITVQVKAAESSVHDFQSYVPIGRAVEKLHRWQKQGADINYLSSRQDSAEIRAIEQVLRTHHFPRGELFSRQPGETYGQIAERIMPNILIEDDCQSIGSASQMTITQVEPRMRAHIHSVCVPEFAGIDHLPDLISEMLGP